MPAELFEQVEELVRLHGEPTGQPQLDAERRWLNACSPELPVATTSVPNPQYSPINWLRNWLVTCEVRPRRLKKSRPSRSLGLECQRDADHGVRAVGQIQPGRVRLAVLVDRTRARSCRRRCIPGSSDRSGRPWRARCTSPRPCRPDSPSSSISSLAAGGLHRRGEPGIPLVNRDRGTVGELAELLDRLGLDLVPVDRLPGAVRDQDDQTPVRDAGEHPLDDLPGLVHARDHDDHVLLDRADAPAAGTRRLAPTRSTAWSPLPLVELDHPLQLMNPDGAETLGPVRTLQTHAATVPGTSCRRSDLR